jgi:hypothetical protein
MRIARKKRVLITFVGLSLGSLLLGLGCGGKDTTYVPPPGGGEPLPEVLEFTVSDPVSADSLEIVFVADTPAAQEVGTEEILFTLKVLAISLAGTYDRVKPAFALESGGQVVVEIDIVDWETYVGCLTTKVTERVEWEAGDYPTAGELEICFEPEESEESMTLAVKMNPIGVDISVGGVPLFPGLPWKDFEDWLPFPYLPVPDPVSIARSGFMISELALGRAELAFGLIEFIYARGTDLEAAGSDGISVLCDEFPPGSGAGSRLYVWFDTSGNGTLGPDDDFTATYNTSDDGCWIDEPDDDIDVLYKGILSLIGYIDQAAPFRTGGELVFEDLVETETEEKNGSFEVSALKTITSGGFNLILEE